MSSLEPNQHFFVEHLATFSTNEHQGPTTPKVALQRLFAMEKTSGIWTQRMALRIEGDHMLIIDGESSDIVERFPVGLIKHPTAFHQHNDIYNNILILTVTEEREGQLHIFQCVSHSAQQMANELNNWMQRHGNNYIYGNRDSPDAVPTRGRGQSPSGPNVSVKQAVNAFNAIAAQRENRESMSPVGRSPSGPRDHDSRSVTTNSSIESGHQNGRGQDQNLTNERYVSILNHCFDDIERFIIRLQHAAAALRELQIRNNKRGGKGAAYGGDGLLAIRARGPSEEEFLEILAKFKLAFNLLAKLKGCIHDPNAPELVHFLFTPLAIIIEAARGNGPIPIDPSVVGLPYLNSEAIELLSNCCTSKEFDLWQSLGNNWNQPLRHYLGLHGRAVGGTPSYQPVFTDGWAPNITEPELMGFGSSSDQSEVDEESLPPRNMHSREGSGPVRGRERPSSRGHKPFLDSDIDDSSIADAHQLSPIHRGPPPNSASKQMIGRARGSSPTPSDSTDHDYSNDLEQSEWLAELQSRNAKIVRVLFPRTANNEKELTVIRGEFLEILDDSRKWWKARNWRGIIAHVPHTIVSEVSPSFGRESSSRNSETEDWVRKERQGKKGEFRYF